MLAESFSEPLSGRMVRVGGASMRAGQVVPTTGGYQTLLDTKVLPNFKKESHNKRAGHILFALFIIAVFAAVYHRAFLLLTLSESCDKD